MLLKPYSCHVLKCDVYMHRKTLALHIHMHANGKYGSAVHLVLPPTSPNAISFVFKRMIDVRNQGDKLDTYLHHFRIFPCVSRVLLIMPYPHHVLFTFIPIHRCIHDAITHHTDLMIHTHAQYLPKTWTQLNGVVLKLY